MPLIPTSRKERLHPGYSYPVGAEAVSHRLASAPQYENIGLSFVCFPTLFASEFRQALEDHLPLPIARAAYQNLSPGYTGATSMIESGFYGERWELDVYSVPSRSRKQAAQQLTASPNGFSRIHAWFAEPRCSTWKRGRKYLWVLLNLENGSVSTVETEGEHGWRWPFAV